VDGLAVGKESKWPAASSLNHIKSMPGDGNYMLEDGGV
jgi:hypothetical protein